MMAAAAETAALPINMAGTAAGASAGAAAAGGLIARTVGAAIVPVFITGATMAAGEALGLWKTKSGLDMLIPDEIGYEMSDRPYFQQMRKDQAEQDRMSDMRKNPINYDMQNPDWRNMLDLKDEYSSAILDKYGVRFPKKQAGDSKEDKPNEDKVTGQRVITYNISIREINGIKENTVQAGGKMDPKQVAEIVRDEIIGALHDSQIRGGQ
jgi:hypothetical protein